MATCWDAVAQHPPANPSEIRKYPKHRVGVISYAELHKNFTPYLVLPENDSSLPGNRPDEEKTCLREGRLSPIRLVFVSIRDFASFVFFLWCMYSIKRSKRGHINNFLKLVPIEKYHFNHELIASFPIPFFAQFSRRKKSAKLADPSAGFRLWGRRFETSELAAKWKSRNYS